MDIKSAAMLLLIVAMCHVTWAGRESRRRRAERAERDSNRSHSRNSAATREENGENIRESLLQLESKLNNKVSAIEHKLSWKINDRIRKINHTLEIAHLENLFHLVNNELEISIENEENQKQTIENLKRVITAQDTQLSNMNRKLDRLEDIVVNLTQHIEVSDPGGVKDGGILQELSNQIQQSGGDEPYVNSQYPRDCGSALATEDITGEGSHFTYIQPWLSPNAFEVRCEVEQNQGWTVIQKRQDGSVDFFRGWRDYRNGFGTFRGEFWLGLQHIYHITNQGDYALRIEMHDWDDNIYWAEYEHFRIENEANNYRLHVHGYSGDAGDSLTSQWENHNGQPFSTFDNDNDGRFYDNCAMHYEGAWWFTSCFESHLNGKYYHKGEHDDFFTRNGIQWNTIHMHSSLKAVQMMILPHEEYVEPDLYREFESEYRRNAVN